ncbi:MAG TPA: carboxypeptidase-like regulatory domain-containing protein [Xanthobacteraceae bacterium]|jgi:hypothetical protein
MNGAHLTRLLIRSLAATCLVVGLTLSMSGGAWAGGTGLDERDEDDAGTPFFGFAKDLDAKGKGIADTKVVAEVKGGNASLVTRTDAQGHFKISGFGKDVDPNTIEVTCSKEGYALQRAARRRLSNDPGSPVEVDCLMVKQ